MRKHHWVRSATLLTVPLMAAADAGAVAITFDYSRDALGFFNDPARRTMLNLAAASFTGFADSLAAITPSGINTFTATFSNPATGLVDSSVNLAVPAGTLVIYAGGRPMAGTTLGVGGPGGYSVSGTQSFFNAVTTRGQAGVTQDVATSTDFGPWGGALSFDLSTNWNFAMAGPSSGQSDFFSVAIHELAHVLGFGTARSFDHWISGTSFTGPASKVANGGANAPLNADVSHWQNGKTSTLAGSGAVRETAMDPSLTTGTRKVFTALDYGAMDDIGWEVRYPGDLNADGRIGADDFALLDRGRARGLAGWGNGDLNADGTIDAADYLVMDFYYGVQQGALEPWLVAEREGAFGEEYVAQLSAMVPEPGMAVVLLVAVPVVAGRRGRRGGTADRVDVV